MKNLKFILFDSPFVVQETGIRDCIESGYALFSDNPIASVEHCLQAELKVFCLCSSYFSDKTTSLIII